MLINKRILLFTLLSGAICSVFAVQYSDSIGWKNLPYIKQSEAWLNSENAAGLHTLPIPRITTAEVYVDKQNGGFIDYFSRTIAWNSVLRWSHSIVSIPK